MDFKNLVETNQICSVPWTHLDINLGTGRVIPCCKYHGNMGNVDQLVKIWSGDEMKRLRESFLNGNGTKLQECNKCYTEPGVFSLMKVKNKNAQYFDLLEDIDITDPKLPNSATISLNNICNLACRMCTPMFSSKLAELVKKSPIIESMIDYEPPNKFSYNLLNETLVNMKFVSFLGGEPLFNKEFVTILQNLKEHAKNLKVVNFSTNMTVLNIPVFEELKDIKYTFLLMSIDGDKDIHNYIRGGADYDSIIDNIKYVAKHYPMIKLIPSCTISALNVGYLPEYIESMNKLESKLEIKFPKLGSSLVEGPIPMHPASLPDHVKNMYIEKLLTFDKSKHIIPSSEEIITSGLYLLRTTPRTHNPDKFFTFINEYDRLLKTDYKKVYPELA